MKYVFMTLLVLILVGGAFYIGKQWNTGKETEIHKSELVLENIKQVWKLSTVEANVSEIYKFSDSYYYNISPFSKSVLVRVKASILAGYDFDSLGIEVNEDLREVRVSSFPEPEILSVDHDLTYYDMRQGTFNSFSPEDLTKIQSSAKDSITNDEVTFEILKQAEQGKNDMLEMMRLAVKGMGYELITEDVTEPVFID